MTEKQFRKADSMVLIPLLVVMAGVFLNMLGMLSTGGGGKAIQIVAIVSVLGICITVLMYMKFRGKKKCGIFMSIATIIVWGTMVILVDRQFFYMLAAPIFIAQMAYLEKKRILITAAVVVPVFTAKSMMLSQNGIASPTEAGTSIILLYLLQLLFQHKVDQL